MILASLIYVVILHGFLFSRRGLLDPVSFFFLVFLYYSFLTPIVMIGFDFFSVNVGAAHWVTREIIDKAAVLFAIGYTGFALAYYALTGRARAATYQSTKASLSTLLSDPYLRIMLGFVAVIIVLISTVFREALLASTESYEGKISGNYLNSGFAFLMSVALTSFSLILNYIILNANRFLAATVVGIALCLMLSVVTFSKYPLIFGALAFFCALYRLPRIPFPLLLMALIFGALTVTVVFLPIFSLYRATGELEFAAFSADTVDLMIAEASSPFAIIHLGLNGYINPDGHPLWHSFVMWIPRGIWEDRPYDIAESFAQQFMVNWQVGQGLGFSPFAEAYVRAGLLGSFFFMMLLGATMALLQRGFASMVPEMMRAPAMLTIGGIVSVLVLRGPFSGLITQSIQNWVPIILVSVAAGLLAKQSASIKLPGRI